MGEVCAGRLSVRRGASSFVRQEPALAVQAAAVTGERAVRPDHPVGLVVPCHRVIGADGSLTGYGGGLHRKRWLLAHETGRAPAH